MVPPPAFAWMDAPDGARLRHARWNPQGAVRGTVVLLEGRSEFIEKLAELAGDWLARGFCVLALDWRGQGLSTRPLPQAQRGHTADFRRYEDDLDLFMASVVGPQATGPLVLFAHSMGGLNALNWLVDHPDRNVAGLLLSAPMLAINTAPLPSPIAAALARMACHAGLTEAYAPGQGDYDRARGSRFEGNVLTGDSHRFRIHHDGFATNPELALGGVTYGWLNAAYRAMARLFAPGVPESIAVPVLLLSAPADQVVDARAHRAIARRLPRAVLCEYPEARHELMMETDAVRDRVWADIDGFLDTLIPVSRIRMNTD
ncbi:MAG TPA: alpha/beta hydrolase [Azospirillaceae bacterium]|nr:alpha/beta hydrolase [Azospirillaceae bacterium]